MEGQERQIRAGPDPRSRSVQGRIREADPCRAGSVKQIRAGPAPCTGRRACRRPARRGACIQVYGIDLYQPFFRSVKGRRPPAPVRVGAFRRATLAVSGTGGRREELLGEERANQSTICGISEILGDSRRFLRRLLPVPLRVGAPRGGAGREGGLLGAQPPPSPSSAHRRPVEPSGPRVPLRSRIRVSPVSESQPREARSSRRRARARSESLSASCPRRPSESPSSVGAVARPGPIRVARAGRAGGPGGDAANLLL